MRFVGLRYLGFATTGLLLGAAMVSACSDSGEGGSAINTGGGANAGGSANAGGASGSSGSGNSGGFANFGNTGGQDDGGLNPDSACAQQAQEATLVKKPVDVIFIVDNSCSMSNEITSVEQNISVNFAQIIAASGVDYRVIMIGENGPNGAQSICIGPPLGGTSCPAGTDTPPVNNPPLFYHYDNNDVESHDSWCKAINWYDKEDRHGLAKTGWREWLRPDSFKAFVEVTDDGVSCSAGSWSYSDGNNEASGQTAAQQFDADLLARDPAMFGTAAERNYIWYSILGMAGNPNNPNKSWAPTDPMTTAECSSGEDPGTGYQALSIMTGGLRFPVCEGQGFDVVFQEIAKGVIAGAQVACEFDVPTPPDGKEIDLESVEVEYTPGGGGTPGVFSKVDSAAQCQPNSFYIEGDQIKLCPDTCTLVQADDSAKIQVLFGCKSEIPT